MDRYADDPLKGWGPGAILLRFLLSAFFGFLLGLTILAATWVFWLGAHVVTLLWWVPVGLPVLSGILGVFWFQQIIDALRQYIEAIFSMRRYR